MDTKNDTPIIRAKNSQADKVQRELSDISKRYRLLSGDYIQAIQQIQELQDRIEKLEVRS